MQFKPDSKLYEGAYANMEYAGTILPLEYGGAREEYLASRETAWLGSALCLSPVYEVSGPQACEFLGKTATNKANFADMKAGQSKHMLICNEKGNLIADGVCMCREAGVFRTYWLAPVLTYLLETSGMDVKGEWFPNEYFLQVDGPKSLEILEDATHTDLHDLKFARNKQVEIAGTKMTVHRLGMSGALAYEVHGDGGDAEKAYTVLRASLEKFGGKPLGFRNYVVLNHTPAGYPNQFQHYAYDLYTGDSAFTEFCKKNCPPQYSYGSVEAEPGMMNITPYDIGWGYLVNFDHDFTGKEALAVAKEKPRCQAVTLEWNTEDVADVFKSQFLGPEVEPYAPIEAYHDSYNGAAKPGLVGSLVKADGKTIGYAAGRCYAFYERRMISLGFIDPAHAIEGDEVTVIWGAPGMRQKEIRAKIAQFPYYQGKWRNETCDVNELVPPFSGR